MQGLQGHPTGSLSTFHSSIKLLTAECTAVVASLDLAQAVHDGEQALLLVCMVTMPATQSLAVRLLWCGSALFLAIPACLPP